MASGIYQITCAGNGKKYIGSAVDFVSRKRVHLCLLKKGTHHSTALQRSWNKYGESCFEFSLVQAVEDKDHLFDVEQEWIDRVKPELNMTMTAGRGARLGMKFSAETIEKMRASHLSAARVPWNKGKKASEETRQKIREARARQTNIGSRKWTDEERKKQSDAKIGKKMPERSDEHKRKLSEALTGKKHTEESKNKMSQSQKGKRKPPRSEEHRRKISEMQKARVRAPVSEETKRKLSEAAKKQWENKRGVSA